MSGRELASPLIFNAVRSQTLLCKHTRYVDMGTANDHCTATHNYEPQKPQQQQIPNAKHQQGQVFQI